MFQLLLGVGCVNALAYNVVHYLMIQRTSAVTTTVLGEIKIVGLLILSALLLGETTEHFISHTLACTGGTDNRQIDACEILGFGRLRTRFEAVLQACILCQKQAVNSYLAHQRCVQASSRSLIKVSMHNPWYARQCYVYRSLVCGWTEPRVQSALRSDHSMLALAPI